MRIVPLLPVLFNKRPAISALSIACLLISLSACANSSTGKALEESLAADPKLKENPVAFGSPSQTNPQNETTAKLPADFPTEIPLYPQAKLQEVTQIASRNLEGAGVGQTTRWMTGDPSNFVQSFYQNAFRATNGWQLSQPTESEQGNAATNTLVARRDNLKVTVSIQTGSVSSTTAIATPSPTPNQSPGNTTEFTIQHTRETGTAIGPSPTSPNSTTPVPSPADTGLKPAPTQPAAPSGSSAFTDINNSPTELRQYIEDLAALGVLTQDPTSSKSNSTASKFEPNKTIARREYARWLVAANNQIHSNLKSKQIRLASETSLPAFRDVPRTDPDFPAIQGLAEAGLIPSPLTGEVAEVLFRPAAPLTRENLILWKVPLDNRSSLPNATVDAVKQTWGFQDAGKIAPLAVRSLLVDFQNGETSNIRRAFGYTTLFQPKKPVTRAEAAAVLWYFGSQGEGLSAKEALQLVNQQSQPSPTPEPSPSSSPSS